MMNYSNEIIVGTGAQVRASLIPTAAEIAEERHTAPATWAGATAGIIEADRLDWIRENHPLMKSVPITGKPQPPEWVINGVIGEGLVSIAGQEGIGKTTTLFPLALIAAGVLQHIELSPNECWRNVIYVSEDTEQVNRIASGLVRAGLVDSKLMAERVRLVPAVRTPSGELVLAGQLIAVESTRFIGNEPVKPLMVLDTKSACVESEDENSNSETSRTIADLKQRFAGLPTWIVGHVSKTNFGRSDIDAMSGRGASSLGGDVNQTMFLIKDGDSRWLVNGKTRFEAKHRELRIDSHVETIMVKNRFGHEEQLALRYGIPTVPDLPRSELAAAAKADAKAQEHADLRELVLHTLRTTQGRGERLNQTGLRERIQRNKAAIAAVLFELIDGQWVIEVSIPTSIRAHPKRTGFLFALTTEQHDRVILDGQAIPPEAKEIPPDWRKSS